MSDEKKLDLGIEITEGEEFDENTIEELSNGLGDDE